MYRLNSSDLIMYFLISVDGVVVFLLCLVAFYLLKFCRTFWEHESFLITFFFFYKL